MRRGGGILLGLLVATTPALAAPKPVARPVPAVAAPAQPDQALRRRVATCIAASATPPLYAWLDTLPGSEQDGPLATRFSLAACMDKAPGAWGRFGARDAEFRMLVTEALVARRLAGLPAASPVKPGNARWYDAKLAALPSGATVDRDALALDDFGTCVAESDWAASVALLRSPSGSPAEKAAVATLTPKLAPCTALQVAMDRSTLRLIVASGVYRLAVAPAMGGVAG
ncbi:MAG: hypothetical protein JOY99_13190 [Sphingomonadaceae bacterium]|nr:hypothetical protein [Sphingomonadaceae bacterium]